MEFKSRVRPEQNGLLLSQALAARFTYHSQAKWLSLIHSGCVQVNNSLVHEDIAVTRDQEILYCHDNWDEPPVPTHYTILQENQQFLMASKPAGTPIHKTGRIFYNTFTNILRRELQIPNLTPVHRLDRDTSGIVLYTKKNSPLFSQQALASMVSHKFYLAIVQGNPNWSQHECTIPLAQNNNGLVAIKMVAAEKNSSTPNAKPCCTQFYNLGTIQTSLGSGSLILARLHTGRKHQIRAHLAALGYPIFQDKIYNGDGSAYIQWMQNGWQNDAPHTYHLLHAYCIGLTARDVMDSANSRDVQDFRDLADIAKLIDQPVFAPPPSFWADCILPQSSAHFAHLMTIAQQQCTTIINQSKVNSGLPHETKNH